jgi:hypothetical protein
MKALLICPDQCRAVEALAEFMPLCNLPILGKPLIAYWLEYLAAQGVTQVYVLATDRPEQVRALLGDGACWGLKVEVRPEVSELSLKKARAKFRTRKDPGWLPAPHDATRINHLPGSNEPLFTSYASWFAAVQKWMPQAATSDRIGLHEVQPGVWVGLHARIAPNAVLRAPVWIGQDVRVGPRSIIGPGTILEDRSLVEGDSEVVDSIVGPETFIGKFTEVRRTLAWGSSLVNWKLNSWIKVQEAFLICPLGRTRAPFQPAGLLSRLAAAWVLTLTWPIALFAVVKSLCQGRRVLRPMLAVRPRVVGTTPPAGDTLIYYQFSGVPGWLRRWPQLFSILRGDFTWIGNRPLSPREAMRLNNDFEKLWLAAPLGLISLADTESGKRYFDDEARAHASYYAAQASLRLDWVIFLRAVFLFAFGLPYSKAREHLLHIWQPTSADGRQAQ